MEYNRLNSRRGRLHWGALRVDRHEVEWMGWPSFGVRLFVFRRHRGHPGGEACLGSLDFPRETVLVACEHEL